LAAEAPNNEGIIRKRTRKIDHLVQQLVVASRGEFEAIPDGTLFRSWFGPPSALEIEDRAFPFGQLTF
jgi:hypothetical protein